MNQQIEPRLLKGVQAEYERATFTGKNESGVRCIGKNVVVLVDQCSDKTSGSVLLPPEIIERMNVASESGVLVALGGEAFSYYDDGTKWTDYKPEAGERVFFERYAGREIRGRDGKTYRLMSYTCIGGLEEEPEDQAAPQKAPQLARGGKEKG
jgi:chaperonin GroES